MEAIFLHDTSGWLMWYSDLILVLLDLSDVSEVTDVSEVLKVTVNAVWYMY